MNPEVSPPLLARQGKTQQARPISRLPVVAAVDPHQGARLELERVFRSPSREFGPVPFWWWTGDPIDRDRLLWQLDQLKERGVHNAIISYNHDARGNTDPGDPAVFSAGWWDLFCWMVGECKKRGMQISFQDYTLINPILQEIGRATPEMRRGGQLREVSRRISHGSECILETDAGCTVIRASAWAVGCNNSNGKVPESGQEIDITSRVENGRLRWTCPAGQWLVSLVFLESSDFDPMHPDSGNLAIERLFTPFEKHCPGEVGKTIPLFFQDELDFGARMPLWSERLPGEFRERKGYDLLPHIAALWHDIGPITAKVRIDYADVATSLLEESYFIPIFQWHEDRGTLWANDNCGRGGIEAGRKHYSDAFRTMRWYSAPGTDDPKLSEPRAFKGLKVNSSIAHLYRRKRVWNECFHSSGWGTTPAEVIAALNEDFVYGATVVNLHGLYYSTHGSWWEWAPPDFHFRQPYWKHLDAFSGYVTRLSSLLSQGVHACDVAVLYPITALEGGLNPRISAGDDSSPYSERQAGKTSETTDAAEFHAFGLGRHLFDAGIDFDFIDSNSVNRAETQDGMLDVAGERYRVLILPVMSSIRFSVLEKIREFQRSGGLVIAFGALPRASDRAGADDPILNKLVEDIFAANSTNSGLLIERDYAQVRQAIERSLARDFMPGGAPLQVLHRRTDFFDVYFVFNPTRQTIDANVTFRAKGSAELCDAWTGTMSPLPGRILHDGTQVRLHLGPSEARAVVITPPANNWTSTEPEVVRQTTVKVLSGPWEFDLAPTMDNRFGDFRLPASGTRIGAEARQFRYAEENAQTNGWNRPDFDDSDWPMTTCSFGPRFWKLGPIPPTANRSAIEQHLAGITAVDPSHPVWIDGHAYRWETYNFSLRWGVEDDPFLKDWLSGPHGLKGRVPDEYIDLHCDVPGSIWYLWTSVQSPVARTAKIEMGSRSTYQAWLNGESLLSQPGALPPGRHAPWNVPHYESNPLRTKTELRNGSNPLLLRLAQADGQRVRAYCAIDPPAARESLALRWFSGLSNIVLNHRPGDLQHAGWYRFLSPPGLTCMHIVARGSIRVWIAGSELSVQREGERESECVEYRVIIPSPSADPSVIAMRIEQRSGSFAGDALPEPIQFECAKGRVCTGDWSDFGLATYSGAAWYRRAFSMESLPPGAGVLLDLGRIAATASVHLNGKLAATLIAPPWQVDLTDLIRTGENYLEIMVANTLANHYSVGVPTPYVFPGQTISGLLGPVRLITSAASLP